MFRISLLARAFVPRQRTSVPELLELTRVLRLYASFPSDALKARATELIFLPQIPEGISMRPSEVRAVIGAALAFNLDHRDAQIQRILRELDECLISCGGFLGQFIAGLATHVQKTRHESELKNILTAKLLRTIRTLDDFTLSKVTEYFRRFRVTDKVLWGAVSEQLTPLLGGMYTRRITAVLKHMSECQYYNKEFFDELERVILSSQLAFCQMDLRRIIDVCKAFGRPTGNLHAFANRTEDPSTTPNVFPPIQKKIELPPAILPEVKKVDVSLPERKTFADQEAIENAKTGLTLSEKEELERKILGALPRISIDDTLTVLVSARQKGAESPLLVSAVCNEIVKRHAKDPLLSSAVVCDVSLALIRCPHLTDLKTASEVEDTLHELYDGREIDWIDPTEDPKLALRQISIFTEVVLKLPRLAGTELLQSFISRVISLGEHYETFLTSGSHSVRQSLPAYAFQTVRLLSASNSFAALDAHRVGISLGLHGLPPVKAAEIMMTVAALKSPPRPTVAIDSRPLNAFLFEALVDVFSHRGVTGLNPTLAGTVLEGLLVMKRSSITLTLQCMDIIAGDARSIMADFTGTQTFDSKRHVAAVRRGMMLLSGEQCAAFFQQARVATLDTVGMALRQSSITTGVLVEALHAATILATCDAGIAASSSANEKRWNTLNNHLAPGYVPRSVLQEKKAQVLAGLKVRTREINMIDDIARRLRTAMAEASASETVTVLKCLGMLRDVSLLQTPLIMNELPLIAVKRATRVLGSGSPAIISGLITSAGVMGLPDNVYGPFSRVCSRALLDALTRESSSSTVSVARACAYARAAHAIQTYGPDLETSRRFGVLLWKQLKDYFANGTTERVPTSSADLASVLFLVSAAFKDNSLELNDQQKDGLISLALSTALSTDTPCSPISFASLVAASCNFGLPRDATHPLYQTTGSKRLLLGGTPEALAILTREGLKNWVMREESSQTMQELNALASAVASAKGETHDTPLKSQVPEAQNTKFVSKRTKTDLPEYADKTVDRLEEGVDKRSGSRELPHVPKQAKQSKPKKRKPTAEKTKSAKEEKPNRRKNQRKSSK